MSNVIIKIFKKVKNFMKRWGVPVSIIYKRIKIIGFAKPTFIAKLLWKYDMCDINTHK